MWDKAKANICLLQLGSQHREMKTNIQKQCPVTLQGHSYPFSLFQELFCVAAVQFSDSPKTNANIVHEDSLEKNKPKSYNRENYKLLRYILVSDYLYLVGLIANCTLLWLYTFKLQGFQEH